MQLQLRVSSARPWELLQGSLNTAGFPTEKILIGAGGAEVKLDGIQH